MYRTTFAFDRRMSGNGEFSAKCVVINRSYTPGSQRGQFERIIHGELVKGVEYNGNALDERQFALC